MCWPKIQKITQSGVPDYANSYGEVQTGSGPDFPNVNYGVKFLKFDSDLVRGSATFRILHTPLGWGGVVTRLLVSGSNVPTFFGIWYPMGKTVTLCPKTPQKSMVFIPPAELLLPKAENFWTFFIVL